MEADLKPLLQLYYSGIAKIIMSFDKRLEKVERGTEFLTQASLLAEGTSGILEFLHCLGEETVQCRLGNDTSKVGWGSMSGAED